MRWTSLTNLFFSGWLISSPFILGINQREIIYSDVFSGLLAGALAVSDLSNPRLWKKWSMCFAGIWLLFAPLVFWTNSAACYANDTLIGTLFIMFSVVFPIRLDAISHAPVEWSYNPSSWHHRIPVVALAFIGFFIARYMAAFQLGHFESIWDPFYGEGTKRVLTSTVAKSFPISDAGLGAVAYLLEGLSGLVGDVRRWRTMPWMVFLFFILVVPAGVVSIVLIMLQPVVVNAWCALCLATAFATLISIPPAADEIFASCQFLLQAHRDKKPVWKLFWGLHKYAEEVPHTIHGKLKVSGLEGLHISWNLLACAALGIAVTVLPILLPLSRAAANNDYILGALVITFAVLAIAEPIRSARLINILFGLWICVSPLLLKVSGAALWLNIIIGLALIPLSLSKGVIKERYGSWDPYIV